MSEKPTPEDMARDLEADLKTWGAKEGTWAATHPQTLSHVAALRRALAAEAELAKWKSDFDIVERWFRKAKRDHEGRVNVDATIEDAEKSWCEMD